jgi:hypothetical protein
MAQKLAASRVVRLCCFAPAWSRLAAGAPIKGLPAKLSAPLVFAKRMYTAADDLAVEHAGHAEITLGKNAEKK